jgi:hypothetical protein
MGGALAGPVVFLLAIGVLRHFRVLGRHFTPLLAVLLILLALGVVLFWRKGATGRVAVVGFLMLGLLSSLGVRWAPRHRKDDYRSAAAFSRAALARGQRVWWNAAPQGAAYYGLPLTTNAHEASAALAVFGQTFEELDAAPPPAFILVTRPDIYDQRHGVAALLGRGGHELRTNFPGFSVWERR